MGLVLRLWRIEIPLLEFYPSRQIQTADIARNFFRHDFNILNPTVSYLGPGYTSFLIEFPGYNLAVASIYKLFGEVNELYGRLFSIFSWVLAFIILYKLSLILVSRMSALVALFFFSLSPLSVLVSRSFQPDQWMLTLSLASILIFLASLRRQNRSLFFLSAFLGSLAALVKLPALVFTMVPILAYCTFNKRGSLADNIYYLLISTVPTLLWYFYAFFSNRTAYATEAKFSLSTWFEVEVFANPKYYSNIFGYELNLVLLPIGIVLFLLGLSSKLTKAGHFLYWWLGGVILYFLLFNKHNMTHEYYHLPFLPIASIFIGYGTQKIIQNLRDLTLPKKVLIFALSIVIFLMMLPPTLARAYKPIGRFSHVEEAGRAIQKLTNPDDLIIGSMDAGPTLVYYSDRSGWPLEIDKGKDIQQLAFWGRNNTVVKSSIDNLEDYIKGGAKYLVIANLEDLDKNTDFRNYIYNKFDPVEDNENYLIFNLNR